MRFSVKCAFSHLGKRGATSRKSAFRLWPLTERRILGGRGHGKAHSVRRISRKSALCMRAVTQTASLRHGGTAWGSECAFPSRRGHRMRLCVSVRGQSALFRKLRFSSPGQTWRRLTEKRTLGGRGHGKAHSACGPSRKSALCTSDLTEKRILQPAGHGKAHSVRRISRKSAVCVCPLTEKRTLRTRLTKRRTLHASGHAHCIDTDTQPRDSPLTVPQYPKPYDLKFTFESESFRITSCAPPSTSDVDETSVILAFLRSS